MSRYLPNTERDKTEMLSEIGLKCAEDLFKDIPQNVRFTGRVDIPEAISEYELLKHMRSLSNKNKNTDEYTCFLGAGAYDHYIPSVVGHIVSRQEFYTAYTPYQPEISQGTLQAIFEYQTMICELTGMDVANASMYDGASALAEAAIMACQATKRSEVFVAKTVHPECRDVLKTYARFRDFKVVEIGYSNGRIDLAELEDKISDSTAAVIVQNPNFFGIIEQLREAGEIAHKNKALLIASVDPISLAVLKSPGELGADIVIGEGQALGNPISFGGPYLGFFAAKTDLMRKMPGRIVGETTDSRGDRGFVLTIQTREQHIRREKATSNICSNQALNALTATVYLSVMGRQGLKEVASQCLQKAHYAQEQLTKSGKFKTVFNAPFFKEFVVKGEISAEKLSQKLIDEKIIGGYDLSRDYPELEACWMLAVTEKRTKSEIDFLVEKAVGI